MTPVAILLAAGRGSRFDPTGTRLKLLQPLSSGRHAGKSIAEAAALNLLAAGLPVVAVVRAADQPCQGDLHARLRALGCALAVNTHADDGMGGSIACGVRHAMDAAGWLVALADMPRLSPETAVQVRDALAAGHVSAAPRVDSARGHPVGFGAALREELLALEGDAGARNVLQRHPPFLIDIDDPGARFDIDLPEDLK